MKRQTYRLVSSLLWACLLLPGAAHATNTVEIDPLENVEVADWIDVYITIILDQQSMYGDLVVTFKDMHHLDQITNKEMVQYSWMGVDYGWLLPGWEDNQGNPSTPPQPGGPAKKYHIKWRTSFAKKLPGHNHTHRIKAELFLMNQQTPNVTHTHDINVNNGILKRNYSPHALLTWGGQGTTGPTISWETTHYSGALFDCYIDIYKPEDLSTPIRSKIVEDVPVGSASWQWDGKDNAGTYCPKGIYVYKLLTKHLIVAGNWCEDQRTSGKAYDPENNQQLSLSVPTEHVEFVSYPGGNYNFHIDYTVTDTKGQDGNGGTIKVFDPDNTQIYSRNLTSSELTVGSHTDVDVSIADNKMEKVGKYQFIVEMEDKHADYYRYETNPQHVNKDALPCGQHIDWQINIAGDVDENDTIGDQYDEDHEEDIGVFLWVNTDDDNQNGTADENDTGTVTNEDDLVEIRLQTAPTCGASNAYVYLCALSGGSKIKVWQHSNRSDEVVLSTNPNVATKFSVNTLPKSVWVEGIQASDSVRDITLALRFGDPTEDKICITVMAIQKVEIEGVTVDGETNLSDEGDQQNCPWGGKRLYGDAKSPGSQPHDQVDIKATLKPAISGYKVTLKAFDVDDPSNTDPALDNEQNQSDNRLDWRTIGVTGRFTANGSDQAVLTSDANGQAIARFQVPIQPGNNFRVIATADTDPRTDSSDVVSQVWPPQAIGDGRLELRGGLPVSDDTNTPSVVKTTPLLTVWRYIHTELDSMSSVVGNSTAGRINSVQQAPIGTTLWVNNLLPDETDRFQDGKMTVNGIANPLTVRVNSDMNIPPDAVNVYETVTQQEAENKDYSMVDDDDPNLLPEKPLIDGWAEPAWRECFITLKDDGGINQSNDELNRPFHLNVELAQSVIEDGFNSRNSRAPEYWIDYVQSAYQGPALADGDPGKVNPPEGNPFTMGATPSNGLGCLIYLETIRDWCIASGVDLNIYGNDVKRRNLVHELGHTFGLADHPAGDNPNDEMSIMDYDDLIRMDQAEGAKFDASERATVRSDVNGPGVQ